MSIATNSSTINSGMVTQMISNIHNNSNIFNTHSVGRQTYDFDQYKKLILSREFDAYEPEYLVINLFPNHPINVIDTFLILCQSIRLVMTISDITVFQVSLSLLNDLKAVQISNNKIYIPIPFNSLFGNINMNGLYYSTVKFIIQDCYELSNYAQSFSLISKVFLYDNNERNRMSLNNTNFFIQQIGSLHVTSDPTPETSDITYFQIQTTVLNGPTKGFLIQCGVDDLISLKFYINNNIRIDYNQFLIQSVCVKISNNLLYLPFNDSNTYNERNLGSFDGSINLSRLESSTLCLEFQTRQHKVVIHNVYFNQIRQTNGLANLVTGHIPNFTTTLTSQHPIIPIVGTLPNSSMFDMSGNYIGNYITTTTQNPSSTSSSHDISNNYTNYINSMSQRSWTNPNYIQNFVYNSNSSSFTGATASNGNTSGTPQISSIPVGNTIYRLVDPERTTCNISHEEILSNQRYMTCSSCSNNFNEPSIRQWLGQNVGNRRTCPTCREVWTNYNVYVNAVGEID